MLATSAAALAVIRVSLGSPRPSHALLYFFPGSDRGLLEAAATENSAAQKVHCEKRSCQSLGVSHGPAQELIPGIEMRRTLHGLAMPENGGDASEQLCAVDGRIFVAEGVTAGREDGAVAVWPFADHPGKSRESCCCRGRQSELRQSGATLRRQDRGELPASIPKRRRE